MATAQQLSQAALNRLKDEYQDLTTRGRIELAQKIEAARLLGDLSENGDYHAAKEEKGKMEGRIMHLAHVIENAEVVETSHVGSAVVAGSIVSVIFEGESSPEKYLVGSIEEKPEGLMVVSSVSPMGEALIGAQVGDVVAYKAPTGTTLKVTVSAIE